MFPIKSNMLAWVGRLVAGGLISAAGIVSATTIPIGERPENSAPLQEIQPNITASLSQVVKEYGKISMSLDALGTTGSTGAIQVNKPNGAIVRKAYLLAATTGFTSYQLQTGDVKLQGNSVIWEKSVASHINSYNYWADVTAIVKPVVNAAPAGEVNLTIDETVSGSIDGEILAVIFDDPNQLVNNTILFTFGAQNISGDTILLELGSPIDKADPNLILDYSLGISYGYQGYGTQYSIIDVNGQRLSTSSGGEDDGEGANGALITVGGIGDTNVNPADPNATPINARSDDELYDLKPFVSTGDTSITINTRNPSNDDNIFFSALLLGSSRSIRTTDVNIRFTEAETFTDVQKAVYENIIGYYADAVYESTNGANKIGTVSFYPASSLTNEKANVLWKNNCHPNAHASGITTPGLRVEMCDNFGTYNFLSDDAHQQGGGYTLGHEWGHYYYGLYDEYKASNTNDDNKLTFPHSNDLVVPNSIMNRQWSAIGGHFAWLNFSSAKNDTQKTAQFRAYQASAWDTLARPQSEDPRDGARNVLPQRPVYAELKDVKPASGNEARIDLPATSRSALKFSWVASTVPAPIANPLNGAVYNVQLSSLTGNNIAYPDPVLLMAFVYTDINITGMNVQGSVQLPDGSTGSVTFTDDGVAPDANKADGIYSAILNYSTNGVYAVQVNFDNADGKAKLVYDSVSPSQGPDGPVPMPEPQPIAENFTVSKTIQISVTNVKDDDFPNTPADADTNLFPANNVPISGKIDVAGDKDVFKIQALGSGPTYVRITNCALGMNPHIRIIGSDKTTILYDILFDPTRDDYFYLALHKVTPGSMFYVEVSDTLNTATGGLYDFSAGEMLVSEAQNRFPWSMFLPAITGHKK